MTAAPTATSAAETSAVPLLDLRGIGKSFPGVRALHEVKFSLQPGEVHALMGENGAGKSTLMKIIAGVYRKDEGEIRVSGQPQDIGSPTAAQQLGIGIVHQELNLMNHLSCAHNIFIGREPRKLGGLLLDEERINQGAQKLFDRLRLRLDPRTRVGELSVARQQMVEIAKALSFESRVLIMDEPTAALNNAEIDDLFTIIRQLRDEGVGIVYISHKMDEIQRIADRVTILRDGQYIDTVPAASTPMERIIALMVGRELAQTTPDIPDTSGQPVLLEARNIRRGRMVQDVSLTLRAGEIVGLAGLMGAGRTELARAIFGADARDGGEILVRGVKQNIRSPQDAVRAGIGYLSEDRKHFGLALGMDVQANTGLADMAQFVRGGFWLDEGKLAKTATDMVQRLRIKTPGIQQNVRLLSGGNQQKVVIAKWLVRDCDILFFDEPTRGIDIGAKAEIYRLLQDLAAQGRAIVVISSELPEVLRLSHRVLVMCEGRLTGEIPGALATQENIMRLATLRAA
ncbi:sugar ABC transporter ATP-binding protein [Amphibiibacter pelophylacis]|uniref:Sugar ABC transporter ATP-binding protein n=1 Tax=Amphibiibacter pelophylacis TaxID=1799477 RepID=A0ACC6P1N8_9BURK